MYIFTGILMAFIFNYYKTNVGTAMIGVVIFYWFMFFDLRFTKQMHLEEVSHAVAHSSGICVRMSLLWKKELLLD